MSVTQSKIRRAKIETALISLQKNNDLASVVTIIENLVEEVFDGR